MSMISVSESGDNNEKNSFFASVIDNGSKQHIVFHIWCKKQL